MLKSNHLEVFNWSVLRNTQGFDPCLKIFSKCPSIHIWKYFWKNLIFIVEISRCLWPQATCTPTEWTSSRPVVRERSTERSSRPWWRATPRSRKHKSNPLSVFCLSLWLSLSSYFYFFRFGEPQKVLSYQCTTVARLSSPHRRCRESLLSWKTSEDHFCLIGNMWSLFLLSWTSQDNDCCTGAQPWWGERPAQAGGDPGWGGWQAVAVQF